MRVPTGTTDCGILRSANEKIIESKRTFLFILVSECHGLNIYAVQFGICIQVCWAGVAKLQPGCVEADKMWDLEVSGTSSAWAVTS